MLNNFVIVSFFFILLGIIVYFKYTDFKSVALIGIALTTLTFSMYIYLELNPYYFTIKYWDDWKCSSKKSHPNSSELNLYCNTPVEINGKTPPLSISKKIKALTPETRIILLGDSYVWNAGIQDDLSTDYHLAQLEKKEVYNQGRPGGTTSRSWSFLKDTTQGKSKLKIEKVIYIYRDHHNARNAGRGRWFFHPVNNLTDYDKGQIAIKEKFSVVHNFSKFKNLEKITKFFEYLKIGKASEHVEDNDIFKTADIINEMHKITKEKLKSNFYLFFYPEFRSKEIARSEKLIRLLNPGIYIIRPQTKISHQAHNPHPDVIGAKQLANLIYKYSN